MKVKKVINKNNIILNYTDGEYIYYNVVRGYSNDRIKVKALTFDKDCITNLNDISAGFIWETMADRIQSVPINQDIPLDSTFSMNIDNSKNDKSYFITTKDITGKNDKFINLKNIEIGSIRGETKLNIKNISIIENYGDVDQKFGIGCFQYYPENNGKSCKLILEPNLGSMKPEVWYKKTIDAIINDLENILETYVINNISSDSKLFICKNKPPYLGKAVSMSIYKLYPDIDNVSDDQTHQTIWDFNIRIKDLEAERKFKDGIKNLINIYKNVY